MEPALHAVSVERLDDGVVKVDMGEISAAGRKSPQSRPRHQNQDDLDRKTRSARQFRYVLGLRHGPDRRGTFTHHFSEFRPLGISPRG